MVGLSGNPVLSMGYDGVTFAIYRNPEGYMDARINGNIYLWSTTGKTGLVRCRVSFDGKDTVRWFVDDAQVASYFWPYPDIPLFFEAALASANPRVENITFVPAGAAGADGVAAGLTNQSHTVPARFDGTVTDYTGATGQFTLNGAPISASYALSTLANPQGLEVSYSGANYTVSGGLGADENAATLTIRATGNGTFYDQVFTLVKSKGGADGSPAPLITATISASVARYNANDVPTFGDVEIRTVRTNAPDTPLFELVSFNGQQHGFTGPARALVDTYSEATFGTSGPDSLILRAAWLNIIMQSYGGGLRIRTIANGQYDVVDITKVRDGVNGAAGQDGIQLDASVVAMSFQATYGGALKAGQINQTVKFSLADNLVDRTGSTSWSVQTSNCAAAIDANGLVTFSSVTDSGWVQATGVYNGKNYVKRVPIQKLKDQAPPQTSYSQSAPVNASGGTSSSFAAVPYPIVSLQPDGAGNMSAIASLGYSIDNYPGGTRTWNLEVKAAYQLVGASGWSDFSSGPQSGSPSVFTPQDRDPGGINASFSTGGLDPSKVYNIGMFYRVVGQTAGTTAQMSGTFTGRSA
jgi:hypothetical protein